VQAGAALGLVDGGGELAHDVRRRHMAGSGRGAAIYLFICSIT